MCHKVDPYYDVILQAVHVLRLKISVKESDDQPTEPRYIYIYLSSTWQFNGNTELLHVNRQREPAPTSALSST
jgi:hypothetical protein